MMALYKIRILANASITRYDAGETIEDAVDSYNLPAEERNLVLAQVYVKRPDIDSRGV